MNAVPPGFEPLIDVGEFQQLVGPFYGQRDRDGYRVGLSVTDKHLNKRGIVHGGMICTLVDFAMGYAARWVTDPPRSLVTTNLSVDFAGNARPGDWIEARVDIVRPGRQVAFVNCFVYRGEERIARGSGTFLVLRGRSS